MITQDRLKELLHYDECTGHFTWAIDIGRRVKAGDTAGCIDGLGYSAIGIDGRKYKAHRLAFMYVNGRFPVGQADHINHIKTDNRWENLRDVSRSDNCKNRGLLRSNTSGITGVVCHKSSCRWQAQIMHDGRNVHLGLFTNKSDAIKARIAAEEKYKYHKNHGKVL